MAEFLEVREVGLRDGIQSIKTVVPTDMTPTKIQEIFASPKHPYTFALLSAVSCVLGSEK